MYARTADFGLIGSDKYDELPPSSGLQFEPLGKLACRFAFFVPQAAAWNPSEPCSVATSNPNALSVFAAGAGICLSAMVVKEGKVERAPASGETDAGFDLVETGASLAANNLRIVRQGQQVMLGGLWRGADEGSGVY